MVDRTISHYKIVERLGRGGMGEVWKAQHLQLDKMVALKFLAPEARRDEEFRDRLFAEARAAAALDHPNICSVYGIHEADGEVFIEMPFIDGVPLSTKIKERRLLLDEALRIAIEIGEGLQEAHEQGVTHRDIKPDNVMLTTKGQVKIMDFGLALKSGATRYTVGEVAPGTPAYMAPEQVTGQEVDRRADLWALGCVLYEMLTQRSPFDDEYEQAITYAIVNEVHEAVTARRADVPVEVDRILDKALAKAPTERYQTAADLIVDLKRLRDYEPSKRTARTSEQITPPAPPKPKPWIWTAAATLGLLVVGWSLLHETAVDTEQALRELDELTTSGKLFDAFVLARELRRELPNDPELESRWEKLIKPISLNSHPPGAAVSIRPYGEFAREWLAIGQTPLEGESYPIWPPSQVRLSLAGWHSQEFMPRSSDFDPGLTVELLPSSKQDDGFLQVPFSRSPHTSIRRALTLGIAETVDLPAFRFARMEVTNREFAEFVEGGGYDNPDLWREPFILNGAAVNRSEALARFVDSTGRPGPSTWRFGSFPEGQEDHPVSGVSWHEAAAYAVFRGKQLPTNYHWHAASGSRRAGSIAPSSNFGDGPVPVGSTLARSPVGAADTAGNVREWCWNLIAGTEERLALGSAWNDPGYQFDRLLSRHAFDRDAGNGIRLAEYDSGMLPPELLEPITRQIRDYSQEQPVDDKAFESIRRLYQYDPTPLDAETLRIEETELWTLEKVSYNAAYGERIPAYLYLPKGVHPPYRTIVYFPASTAEYAFDSEQRGDTAIVQGLVRGGYAFLWPVIKGHFERRVTEPERVTHSLDAPVPSKPRARRDLIVMAVRDVMRSVDYLESRKDIEAGSIGYLGGSSGARHGAIVLGLEHRFAAAVLVAGGLHLTPRERRVPESDEINFLPQIRTPTVLVGGRYDTIFPLDQSQTYFYNWIGLPEDKKRHEITDRGHIYLYDEAIEATFKWFDRWLGAPK